MTPDLTIFAAQYLVYIDAVLAAVVLAVTLYRRPRPETLAWAVTAVFILVLSLILSRVGDAVYSDPRPFVTDHVPPLIKHAADNGFPSDHALLAAAIVAIVGLVNVWYAIPFVLLAVLVDWARVGAGLHHVTDVVGSSVIVAIATVVALVVVPPLLRLLTPHLPGWVLAATGLAVESREGSYPAG